MAARCALWWRYRATMLGPLLWRALWGRAGDIEWLADADEERREVGGDGYHAA